MQAIEEPARVEGVTCAPEAIEFILVYTEGYPYFIQEFGRAAWNTAEGPVVTRLDAEDALGQVESELDGSFFRARVQRATPNELRYMRATAESGSAEQKASDVAEVLHKTSEQRGRGELFFASSNDLTTQFHYAHDPERTVIDKRTPTSGMSRPWRVSTRSLSSMSATASAS